MCAGAHIEKQVGFTVTMRCSCSWTRRYCWDQGVAVEPNLSVESWIIWSVLLTEGQKADAVVDYLIPKAHIDSLDMLPMLNILLGEGEVCGGDVDGRSFLDQS